MIIEYPVDLEKLNEIHAGDVIEFSGTIYTARDAAHMRIKKMIENNEKLPVNFNNSFIYYAGPTPTMPGRIIGSIGPTTSSRMDPFCDMMKKLNVKATIGKGPRKARYNITIFIKNFIFYYYRWLWSFTC